MQTLPANTPTNSAPDRLIHRLWPPAAIAFGLGLTALWIAYLGYSAVKFLLSEKATEYGAIIGFIQGEMMPMKFSDMLDPETKKMRTRLVKIDGEGYEVARRYMIRLEKRDLDNPEMLANLARVIKWTPQRFRDEFGYLV